MKLTADQAIDIYTSDEPPTVIAERYGVDYTTVFAIRQGQLWGSVTAGLDRPKKTKRKPLKLDDDAVREIRESKESLSTLANRFNVSPSLCSKIKNGHRRGNV